MASTESLHQEFKEAFYRDDFQKQMEIHEELQKASKENPSLERNYSVEYRKFISDLEVVSQCQSYINETDWTIVRESPTIKVECRGSGSGFFTKSTVLVESTFFETLAVLCEADLVSTW